MIVDEGLVLCERGGPSSEDDGSLCAREGGGREGRERGEGGRREGEKEGRKGRREGEKEGGGGRGGRGREERERRGGRGREEREGRERVKKKQRLYSVCTVMYRITGSFISC